MKTSLKIELTGTYAISDMIPYVPGVLYSEAPQMVATLCDRFQPITWDTAGRNFDPKTDLMVGLWIKIDEGDEGQYDPANNGAIINIDNDTYRIRPGVIPDEYPLDLITIPSEGSIAEFIIPINSYDIIPLNGDNKFSWVDGVDLHLKLTAKQWNGRYNHSTLSTVDMKLENRLEEWKKWEHYNMY